jgi:hypothetical protein
MAYGTIIVDKLVGSSGGTLNPDSSVFRNRIINGAMVIDQRNAGASVSNGTGASIGYTLDRYRVYGSQASKLTAQQNAGSVTTPVGFTNYLGCTSSSTYSVLTGDYFRISQAIEGFNTADLAWGTANAKTVTLSFQVYSSLTGTFGGALSNSAQDRSYPFTYSIPVANTWTQISVTIAGDTAGTWIGATNGVGINLYIGLGCGTTYSGTAGAWAAGQYFTATGAVSVVGTNGATFYITGVQLEKGSTATSFDYRPYGTELQLCQRYYYVMANFYVEGYANSGTVRAVNIPVNFPVTMRATPTRTVITAGSYTNVRSSSSSYAGLGLNGLSATFASASVESAAAGIVQCSNQTESMSAEL